MKAFDEAGSAHRGQARSGRVAPWSGLLVLLMGLLLLRATPAGAQAQALALAEARFQALASLDAVPREAPAAWQTVTLPHHWPGRQRERLPAGVYRLRFDSQPGSGLLALGLDAVSERARVSLNGELLHEVGTQPPARHVYRAMPLLVELPPALLRSGANEVELRVEHGAFSRPVLGRVVVGRHAAVSDQHASRLRWYVNVPQTINLVAMCIGAMLVLVWLRRRQEVAIGLFGVVFLTGSARNYGYYSDLVAPPALWDTFQFATVIWNTVLTLLFALHHTALGPDAVRWPALRRGLIVGATASTLLAGALAAANPMHLSLLRSIAYPFIIPVNLCVVWLLTQHARRTARRVDALMALTYAVLVLSSLLDLLLLFGVWKSVGGYTFPWAMPVLMAAFSLVLLDRVLDALRTSEELTHALEQRVAERTLDLQAAHDAKSRFLAAASHDLRQPLHATALLVGLLRDRIRYPELRSLVDRVQSGVDELSNQLSGLLDLSRLEGGRLQPRVEPVALQPLLQAIFDSAAPQAAARGVRLRVVPSRAVVNTDRVLLDSMLRNLVSNAIRYTPAGTVLVGVRAGLAGRRNCR